MDSPEAIRVKELRKYFPADDGTGFDQSSSFWSSTKDVEEVFCRLQ
jgi:hypothetical protein